MTSIKSYKLGIVMDPIASSHYKKDSSLAMLWAAQKSGFELYYMEQQDLYLEQGIARATAMPLQVFEDPQCWYQLGETQTIDLGQLDVILMRKDPPFDMEFIYSTYILEAAERQGCLVVNKPSSLRDCNEKLFATQFPQCCPPVLVSRNSQLLRDFYQHHEDVIYKPLDGMGGRSIFRVKPNDANLNVVIETLTDMGQQQIMAQKYLPEISAGDKRILIVNGEPIPYCLARIPSSGEFRGNLAAGGTGVVQPLSERDRWIAQQISPTLNKLGLLFVGLDVIGDYLTEINVTSPTCIREIDNAQNTQIGELLMSAIMQLLENR